MQAAQAVAASGLFTSKDPSSEAVGNLVLQFARSRGSSSRMRQPQVMALMDDIQVGAAITLKVLHQRVDSKD